MNFSRKFRQSRELIGAIGGICGFLAILLAQTAASKPYLRKWSDSSFPIPWRLNPMKGGNIAGSRELADVIRSSFQSWSSVSTALVSFQEGAPFNGADAGFDQINHLSVVPVNYPFGALAVTLVYSFSSPGIDQFGRKIDFPGQILEADIVFNPTALYSLDVVTPSDRFDLQSVATHEIGHLLGLDHTALSAATMFPTLARQVNYQRSLSPEDAVAISKLYPAGTFFSSRGGVNGVVRTSAAAGVFGAHVVVVDASGRTVASAFTDTGGNYQILGLEPGQYATYVEPLDGPVSSSSISNLASNFPGETAFTNFTTRYASVSSSAPALTVTKTGGDNQTGDMGDALVSLLEVLVTDTGGMPLSGVTVDFAGTSGGATAVPFTGVTDSSGKIRAAAYLGMGLTQSFTAFAGSAKATFTATVRAPVLNSITASSGARGASMIVTLAGKNFVKNATTVSVSGGGVTVSAVTVSSPASLSAAFQIDANATVSVRTVTVSASNGTSGSVNFTVQ